MSLHLFRGARSILGLLVLTLVVAACDRLSPPGPTPATLPTQAPTAAPLPQPSATAGSADLPPTRDIATPTPAPPPTVAAEPSPTAPPVDSSVTITAPADGARLPVGRPAEVGGLARLGPGHSLALVLLSIDGRTLVDEEVTVGDNGGFQHSLAVPAAVSGPAQLQAVVRATDGAVVSRDVRSVVLAVDTGQSDPFLLLYRPVVGADPVGGYYLYFDGLAQRPSGGRIVMQIKVDNCQRVASTQPITMRSSGYWQGFIYVPRNVVGPACATASFGAPGDAGYREAQVPIEIRAVEGPHYGVVIGGPTEGTELFAGQAVTVYGVAYQAREGLVSLDVRLPDGTLLTQAVADADNFGYWEATVNLPLGNTGEAELVAVIGDNARGDFAEAKVRISILPAPPPTREP